MKASESEIAEYARMALERGGSVGGKAARGERAHAVMEQHGPTQIAQALASRKHKYGAVATVVDGHKFPSKREAQRYIILKALERCGQINRLELQPVFPLHVFQADGELRKIGEYRGDFKYLDAKDQWVVEDAKGFKTPLYRWKKKHAEAQWGIVIREV